MTSPVLLTGATGYIGGRVAKSLRGQVRLRIVSRRQDAARLLGLEGVESVRLRDLGDVEGLDAACRGVRAVIHLAGPNEVESAAHPDQAIAATVTGTWRLLEAARKAGVERFIFMSTAHVYGAPLVGAITEGNLTRPVHPYAIAHRAAEDFVLATHRRGFEAAIVLRLSNAVGADVRVDGERWTLLGNDLCRQAIESGRLVLRSDGLQWRDFIAMSDVCASVRWMLDVDAGHLGDGLLNLGGGKAMRVIDFAELVATRVERLLGCAPPIQRPGPTAASRAANAPLDFRIDKLRALGYSPSGDLAEEIDATLAICRSAR